MFLFKILDARMLNTYFRGKKLANEAWFVLETWRKIVL